jgi:TetR/AcrR family transcriptional regulator, mexJK operon transcriptional repressor
MDSSASSSPPGAPRRARRARDVAAERVASVDRQIAAGLDVRTACRRAAVSVPSYYRWRARERGGVGQTERIREMILSAAKTVFLRDGYGASLESIAEAAEVARQTVYNQFGSKEQLFAEVVQAVYQRMLAPIFVVDHRSDLISMLTELGRHLMRVALHPDSLALQRIAMSEYRDTPTLMRVVHTLRASHAIPVLTEYLAEYLRSQMQDGVIDAADPLLSAEAFFGSLVAHARYRLSIGVEGDTPERLETRLRLCVEIFARGFGYRANGACTDATLRARRPVGAAGKR